MSGINEALHDLLGDRVKFDRVERKLYSSDIGVMPKLIKPFLPASIASAVVRPRDEADLVHIVSLSREYGVPLVPRGMSTSGYGGVLPVNKAIVVDMSALAAIVEVNAPALTARVQAGIIWEDLEAELKKQGLALKMYPSSTPSSTVAGWLAQGGTGFGAYENGYFKQIVNRAKVLLPDGTLKVFADEELDLCIADAEGITGIIIEVEFQIEKLADQKHRLYSFADTESLQAALVSLRESKAPLWSVSFLNPTSVELTKKLFPQRLHPYEAAQQKQPPEMPVSYILSITYAESKSDQAATALRRMTESCTCIELPEQTANHEWEQRFFPMRLKRLGPSIIPAEVTVPFNQLSGALNDIAAKIDQDFVLEGMLTQNGNVVLLGYIPHDERIFTFNLAFALSLSIVKIAQAHGGDLYSTGLYFKGQAKRVLGSHKYAALEQFKAEHDSSSLMNPKKILGKSAIGAITGVANALLPLIRPLANRARPGAPKSLPNEIHGIPGNIALTAYRCAQCGYCVPTCEEYSGRGWMSHSPRGKYLYLKEVVEGREKLDQHMVDTLLSCTTCERCNARCQLQLPVEHSWMQLRGKLIEEEGWMTFPPFEMMASSLRGENDIWASRKENRDKWVPQHIAPKIKEDADVLYFAGCTASFVNTDVAQATVELLDRSGIEFTYMGCEESCCGIPMKMAGRWDLFEEIYEHNVAEARKRNVKTVVTSCPACGLVWKELYPEIAARRGEPYEFEVKHYSEIVSEAIGNGRLAFDHPVNACVTFHDSCHMGRAQGNFEAPRDIIKAIPGIDLVEMEHNRAEGLCCGSVLTLVGDTPVAPVLGKLRLDEALEAKAEAVVALCPCCQVQFRDSIMKNNLDLRVVDLAHLACEGLGIPLPDPTDYGNMMWGHFEKFIWLMKPEAIADLMTTLLPTIMDAMPAWMVSIMRGVRHVPGGMSLLGAMMPTMMPKMMPALMPRVMPAMIDEVLHRVGELPDDMAYLIPRLLPPTMDNLLPNMLPLMMPYFMPNMKDYIVNKL
ncbi:MAG: FAD-binding and (Fe-S)-binding domain-containing protein [Raoultibacter sp.]